MRIVSIVGKTKSEQADFRRFLVTDESDIYGVRISRVRLREMYDWQIERVKTVTIDKTKRKQSVVCADCGMLKFSYIVLTK